MLSCHCTSEPETNPTPLMVTVRRCAPGVALAGASGWPINGAGFEIAGWDCEFSAAGASRPCQAAGGERWCTSSNDITHGKKKEPSEGRY